MQRILDSDVLAITINLAGTFTPTGRPDGRLRARRTSTRGSSSEPRPRGWPAADIEVDDLSLILEQVASLRLGDERRTRQLRRRYLALFLAGASGGRPACCLALHRHRWSSPRAGRQGATADLPASPTARPYLVREATSHRVGPSSAQGAERTAGPGQEAVAGWPAPAHVVPGSQGGSSADRRAVAATLDGLTGVGHVGKCHSSGVAPTRTERLVLAIERGLDRWLSPVGVWVMRRTRGRDCRPGSRRRARADDARPALGPSTDGRPALFPGRRRDDPTAANDGGRLHPGWYFNLCANPKARVEVRGRALPVRASWPAPGPRSITQSARATTSRLCSMTMTVRPDSTSRSSRPMRLSTSCMWSPVVGSSRT